MDMDELLRKYFPNEGQIKRDTDRSCEAYNKLIGLLYDVEGILLSSSNKENFTISDIVEEFDELMSAECYLRTKEGYLIDTQGNNDILALKQIMKEVEGADYYVVVVDVLTDDFKSNDFTFNSLQGATDFAKSECSKGNLISNIRALCYKTGQKDEPFYILDMPDTREEINTQYQPLRG